MQLQIYLAKILSALEIYFFLQKYLKKMLIEKSYLSEFKVKIQIEFNFGITKL